MDLFSDRIEIDDLDSAVRLFQESRVGFLTLFNNSPICMSMTTTALGKRTYVRVNKKFLEKFGFTEAEIIGRTSVEIGILDQEESVRVGNIIREKGRLQNDYVKCIAKSGDIVHTLSSIEMMEMGGENFLVSFFIDISKTVKQQQIIEQHMQQLEAVNKELEAFSYSVSHDLRAPLRAIGGYAKMLEEDFYQMFDEEGKRMLAGVQKNAARMSHLIDDLLAFARLGKKELIKTDIDMEVLVREVLAELENSGPLRGEIKVGRMLPVKGDYALIKQVMENLISNGIKYSSKKEQPVVEISSAVLGDNITYTVKDNGEGFDMKYADKLFGVFQRLHSDREFAGTGVGLATVQRIISKHGGSVGAEAVVGQGASFHFTLPREQVNVE